MGRPPTRGRGLRFKQTKPSLTSKICVIPLHLKPNVASYSPAICFC